MAGEKNSSLQITAEGSSKDSDVAWSCAATHGPEEWITPPRGGPARREVVQCPRDGLEKSPAKGGNFEALEC